MNFDKVSKFEENFFFFIYFIFYYLFYFIFFLRGEVVGFRQKKTTNNMYFLLFLLMLCVKYQVPISCGALVLSNGQVRGIPLPMFYRIQSSGRNIDLEQFSEIQDPSSSKSLDISLTRFLWCYNSKVCKGA